MDNNNTPPNNGYPPGGQPPQNPPGYPPQNQQGYPPGQPGYPPQNQYGQPPQGPGAPAPKKSPVVKIVGIVAVLAVLIGGGLIAWLMLGGNGGSTASEQSMVKSVGKHFTSGSAFKPLTSTMASISKVAPSNLSHIDFNMSLDMDIEPQFKSGMSAALQMIDDLGGVSLNTSFDMDADNYKFAANVNLGVPSYDIGLNIAGVDDKGIYITAPKLFDKAILVDYESLKNQAGLDIKQYFDNMKSNLAMSQNMLSLSEQDSAAISKVFDDFATKNMTGDKITQRTAQLEGNSYTEDVFEVKGENLKPFFEAFFTEVAKNPDIKRILTEKLTEMDKYNASTGAFASMSFSDMAADYDASIDQLIESLRSTTFNEGDSVTLAIIPGETEPVRVLFEIKSETNIISYTGTSVKSGDTLISAIDFVVSTGGSDDMSFSYKNSDTPNAGGSQGSTTAKLTTGGSDIFGAEFNYTKSAQSEGDQYTGTYVITMTGGAQFDGKYEFFYNSATGKALKMNIELNIGANIAGEDQKMMTLRFALDFSETSNVSFPSAPANYVLYNQLTQQDMMTIQQNLINSLPPVIQQMLLGGGTY